MDPEQCVEMMEALREAYKNAAQAPIATEQYNKLRHVVTQIRNGINFNEKKLRKR